MSEDKPLARNNKAQKRKKPKVPKKITESYLYNSGLYYLQRFTSSSENFRSVMLRKVRKSCAYHKDQDFEECAKLVDALIDKITELGLLNDEAYVRGMVTSFRNRGIPKRTIIQKLKMKGIPSEQTLQALETFNEERETNDRDLEFAGALKFCRKKRIGPFNNGKDEEFEKSLAKLARQGFSYDIAKKAMEIDTKQAEEKLCTLL